MPISGASFESRARRERICVMRIFMVQNLTREGRTSVGWGVGNLQFFSAPRAARLSMRPERLADSRLDARSWSDAR